MLKRVKRASDFRRLMDEKKALMKLRSKHVVELLDVVTYQYGTDKEDGLILEKISGNDLSDSSFDIETYFYKVCWQIADGLAEIHKAGIIHRDIKPENIRINANGVLKILDFGLARQASRDARTRSIIGTAGYMAPELRSDMTITFTTAVDVYAYGATIIGLLKTTPSTPIITPVAVSASMLCQAYPRLDTSVASMLAACFAPNPIERPSAAEIRDILATQLLRDQHKARVISGSNVLNIDHSSRNATLKTSVGSITIRYDGHRFVVYSISGSVYINNRIVAQGDEMPGACVITFGVAGTPRAFATFQASHPGVTI